MPKPLPPQVRAFVDSTRWTFAKTYARTWPHEYVVRKAENAEMILALARHIFEHGIEGRFYAEVRPYHHEDGKVYWSMDDTPESTTLINRCDESQTYEARLEAGTLPSTTRTDPDGDRSRPMRSTLLAHLAPLMTTQTENLATEAAAFILNRSAAARSALHRLVEALLGEVAPIARVVTQAAVGTESRPDVLLLGERSETLGYVEAKFWAALTEAQPVDYVRRLAESGGGVLVMLAPERRLPTLRADLIERLTNANMAPVDPTSDSLRVGAVRLGLLSWTKLLSALRDAAAGDYASTSDVDQLAGLVTRIEADSFIPLSKTDLDDLDLPRRVIRLVDLIDRVVAAAEAEQVVTTKKLRWWCFPYRSGRYIALPSAGCWIGVNHETWSQFGRTPIWLRFHAGDWGRAERLRECLRDWLRADPPRAYDLDGCIHVPLLLAVGVEQDRVVKGAVSQIRELSEALSAAGLGPLQGGEPTEG